jgi:hypothetical protein
MQYSTIWTIEQSAAFHAFHEIATPAACLNKLELFSFYYVLTLAFTLPTQSSARFSTILDPGQPV